MSYKKTVLIISCLIMLNMLNISGKTFAQDNSQTLEELESKIIFEKIMDEIKICKFANDYWFDKDDFSPKYLAKINKFKLYKKIRNEARHYKIDQLYNGLHAIKIILLSTENGDQGPTIVFNNNFNEVVEVLSKTWGYKFNMYEDVYSGVTDYPDKLAVKRFSPELAIEIYRDDKRTFGYAGGVKVYCQ